MKNGYHDFCTTMLHCLRCDVLAALFQTWLYSLISGAACLPSLSVCNCSPFYLLHGISCPGPIKVGKVWKSPSYRHWQLLSLLHSCQDIVYILCHKCVHRGSCQNYNIDATMPSTKWSFWSSKSRLTKKLTQSVDNSMLVNLTRSIMTNSRNNNLYFGLWNLQFPIDLQSLCFWLSLFFWDLAV